MLITDKIKEAVTGMVLVSERDAPLQMFEGMRMFSPAEFMAAIRRTEDEVYCQQWAALFDLLVKLQNLTIVRVGKVNVRYFIYGWDEAGEAIAITVEATET